ncbi:hypothetical protein M2283_008246 [Streptomyces pseudovenezuelae]|uniref:Uncharacterized protein n=1 Tax=Streptomyces pseudovenezuelae TaxID=67350 RepID=A0ABT6LZQ7_9ACTN|nr:hypothetical protein [Streptomyces pseudovenezuelae]
MPVVAAVVSYRILPEQNAYLFPWGRRYLG